MHTPRYRYRLYFLTLFVLLGTGVLLSRLYEMQIEKKEYYSAKVPSNKEETIREPGIRGEIKDRNGITLAQNNQSYIVYFNLAEIHKNYIAEYGETLKREILVNYKGSPVKSKKTDIAGMVNKTIRPYLAYIGLDAKYSSQAMEAHYSTHGGLVPFVFRKDLSYDEFAKFAEQNIQLPGVYIDAAPARKYPFGATASHVLGYTKQWEKGKITGNFNHYIGDSTGIAGIEQSMNEELTGREGIKKILKNDKNKVLGVTDYQPPGPGSDVYLTIDTHIQQLVENSLRQAGKAAAIVMDPNTGEVLAMASVPNYDPNDFTPSISTKRYAFYTDNTAAPFINRAITGLTPGSTLKIPAAIAGCKYGMHRYNCNCPGHVAYGKLKIKCWKTVGHGTLALAEALQRSCNPFFMKICNTIGYKKVVEVYQMLGLGSKTGIRLPQEQRGTVPGSVRWKKRYPEARMSDAHTGMMGIGQGDCQATPLQMAAIFSAVANGGDYYQPRIISKVTNSFTNKSKSYAAPAKLNLLQEGIGEGHLTTIRYGMRLAATAIGGTARRACPKGMIIGAKTGTAQTRDDGVKTHVAWTAAFAPYENPRYVVIVAVKRGGSGGKVAGPLVNLILSGLFEIEEGKKHKLVSSKPYIGHQDLIEEIKIPSINPLNSIYGNNGETGDEAEAIEIVRKDKDPIFYTPNIKPNITPTIDERGSQKVIPRAIPVE